MWDKLDSRSGYNKQVWAAGDADGWRPLVGGVYKNGRRSHHVPLGFWVLLIFGVNVRVEIPATRFDLTTLVPAHRKDDNNRDGRTRDGVMEGGLCGG